MPLPSELLQQGFCQHEMYLDATGLPLPTVGTPEVMLNRDPKYFSIIGAINHACTDDMYFDGIYDKLIEQVLYLICGPGEHHTDNIWFYNNAPGRTQDEVVDLVSKAEMEIKLSEYLSDAV